MRRLVIAGAALVGVAFLVTRMAPRLAEVDFGKAIAAMPDNAPPKWVFDNVTAIRANTERILEILEGRTTAPAGEPPAGP
jgi:hypothetical protein